MSARPDVPPPLRAVLDTAVALVRRSTSGRFGLARATPSLPAASLPAFLRDEVVAALQRARADATAPLEFSEVERILRDAWGKSPGRVLDSLDPKPIAHGSLTQVHRGELDGEPVAVAVRRPGLPANVRGDLALLDVLAGPLGAAFPAVELGPILREVREAILDELDLEHAGGQQGRVARALRRVDGVRVPRVHPELADENVLVTELVSGPLLSDTAPADPGAAARALLAAHLRMPALVGFVLVDPHPGHVIVDGDEIVLLGTGTARPFDRARLGHALAALRALREDDSDAWVEAVTALGALEEDDARSALPLLRSLGGPLVTGPARLDEAALAEVGERALSHLGELLDLGARARAQPADVPALRGAGQLIVTLAQLGADEDWLLLAAECGAG